MLIYSHMSKTDQKLLAFKLRRKGQSIGSIAKSLSVSKSSVSIWCRDIDLTSEQAELLRKNSIQAGHKGRMMGAETNKKRKLLIVAETQKEGSEILFELSKRELLIAGTALFWAEGTKKGSKLTFINSDPIMITFMYKWFRECLKVKKDMFMPRIFINQIHEPRIKDVIHFWSSHLDLPIEQFGRPVLLKMKQMKKYENYDKYYGILQLGISKPGRLKYQVLGFIEALKACGNMSE